MVNDATTVQWASTDAKKDALDFLLYRCLTLKAQNTFQRPSFQVFTILCVKGPHQAKVFDDTERTR
jgi:hypothetical protein